MRFLLPLLALGIAGAPAALHATDLLNGRDMSGWKLVTPTPSDINQVCLVGADGTVAVAGKPVGYLVADGTYTNYKLHVEWRWPVNTPKNTNGGVLIHIASGPIDRNTWPKSIQVQTKVTRGGDLLPMAGATFAEPLSTKPGAAVPQLNRMNPSSEKPYGEWNTADITCRDGALECSINGVVQNRVTGCNPASGQVGLQLEGFPYDLRNIRIEPLSP
jgi:hypothetical protein